MLDYEAEREIERDINNAVKWYLSSSYGYYIKGDTILTDPYFDQLAVRLRRCLLYTSPSPRDYAASRMPSSA